VHGNCDGQGQVEHLQDSFTARAYPLFQQANQYCTIDGCPSPFTQICAWVALHAKKLIKHGDSSQNKWILSIPTKLPKPLQLQLANDKRQLD
jgi:hypothetical protein